MPPKNSGKFVINKKFNEGKFDLTSDHNLCLPVVHTPWCSNPLFYQEEAGASTQESTRARTGEMTMKANKTSGRLSLSLSQLKQLHWKCFQDQGVSRE